MFATAGDIHRKVTTLEFGTSFNGYGSLTPPFATMCRGKETYRSLKKYLSGAMDSADEWDSYDGESSLDRLLSFVGLLTPLTDGKCSTLRHFRGLVIISMSILAFLYELVNTVNNVLTQTRAPDSGIFKIAEAVNLSQYPLKTFTTMVILMTFWWKSAAITLIIRKVNSVAPFSTLMVTLQTETKKRNSGTRCLTAATLTSVVAYLIALAIYRIVRTCESQKSDGSWAMANYPWPKINLMQEQMINFFMRNISEAMRILCSGYLAVLLYKFQRGLASQSQLSLSSSSSHVPLIDLNIQRAWEWREQALALTAAIQKEIGNLMAFILVADIVALNSTFGGFLFLQNSMALLPCFMSIALYVVSVTGVAGGLIALIEKDDETLNDIKKLVSGLARSAARPESPETLPDHRNWRITAEVAAISSERLAKLEHLRRLMTLKSSCFGTRKAAPVLHVFGYVTRGTISNAIGLLLTFTCFMLDQFSRNDSEVPATLIPNVTVAQR